MNDWPTGLLHWFCSNHIWYLQYVCPSVQSLPKLWGFYKTEEEFGLILLILKMVIWKRLTCPICFCQPRSTDQWVSRWLQCQLEQLECLRYEDTPTTPWLIIHNIDQPILDLKSKQDKVKGSNLKNLPKLQNFEFWKKIIHDTPFEVDKMCKYEMEPVSIVEDTGRTVTRFCPQMDRQTNGHGEASITPW